MFACVYVMLIYHIKRQTEMDTRSLLKNAVVPRITRLICTVLYQNRDVLVLNKHTVFARNLKKYSFLFNFSGYI